MPKFIFTELVDLSTQITARLGAGTGAANHLDDKEVGKLVRQVADSRYDLCPQASEIEGRISGIETAPQDNYTLGTVQRDGRFEVTFDGLQATVGVGNIAINDYVLASSPVAKGTPLSGPPRVCRATAAGNTLNHKWRVVSLGSAGTGAPGTTGLIERV